MDYDSEIIADSEGEDNYATNSIPHPAMPPVQQPEDQDFLSSIFASSFNSPAVPRNPQPTKNSGKPSTISEFPSSGPQQQTSSSSHISSFTTPASIPVAEKTSPIVTSTSATIDSAGIDHPKKPRPKPRRKIPTPRVDAATAPGPSNPSLPSTSEQPASTKDKPVFIEISSSEDEFFVRRTTKPKPPKRIASTEDSARSIAPKRARIPLLSDSDQDDPMRLMPPPNDPPPPYASVRQSDTLPNDPPISRPTNEPVASSSSRDVPKDQVPPSRSKQPSKKRKSSGADGPIPPETENDILNNVRLEENVEGDETFEPPATTKKKRKTQDKKSTKSSKKFVESVIDITGNQSQRSSTRVALARSLQEDGVIPPGGEYDETVQSREEKTTDKPLETTSEGKRGGGSKRSKSASGVEIPEQNPAAKDHVQTREPKKKMKMVVEIPRHSKDLSEGRKVSPSPSREPPPIITRDEGVIEPEVDAPQESSPEKPPKQKTQAPHKVPRDHASESQTTSTSAKPNENFPPSPPAYRRPNKPLTSLLNQSGTTVRPSGLAKSIKIAPLHVNRKPVPPKPKEIPKKKVEREDGNDEDDNWGEKPSAKIKRLMREFDALEGMEGKKADAKRQELLDEMGRINA